MRRSFVLGEAQRGRGAGNAAADDEDVTFNQIDCSSSGSPPASVRSARRAQWAVFGVHGDDVDGVARHDAYPAHTGCAAGASWPWCRSAPRPAARQLVGILWPRRSTRWHSVPTTMVAPAGACCTTWMMPVVEPSVGSLHHRSRALGMHDHMRARDSAARAACTSSTVKARVDASKSRSTPPRAQFARVAGFGWLEWIPDADLLGGDAHIQRGVGAQVLVGQEEDVLASPKGPVKDLARVGRGADGAAVPPHKGFDLGRRVLIGDGHDGVAPDRRQRLPGALRFGGIWPCWPSGTALPAPAGPRSVRRSHRMAAVSAMKWTPQKTI